MYQLEFVTVVVGFIHGFIGQGTIRFGRILAEYVIAAARDSYDPGLTKAEPRMANSIAYGLSVAAVFVLHLLVAYVIVETISKHSTLTHAHFGRFWLYAFFAGAVVSRLLPEIEANIRKH